MKRILPCLVLVLLLGAAASPVSAHKLQVVTTFSILQDLVQQVGGERLEVSSLIPSGMDPHSWEPTPRDARAVANADLIIANGGGFDDWLFGLVGGAAQADALVIVVSEGLDVIEHEDSHGHGHQGDPHFWLNVTNAIYYVEQIAQGLTTISPEDASYFRERADSYRQELADLDRWMIEELARIPEENRVIVAYHNAFSYLAERYGFAVADFLVANPEAEPTPRDLARLVELLRGMSRRAIFTEPQIGTGTRYMQSLAKEVQGEIYTLYSDSFGPEAGSYVEMMKYNTQTLMEALE
ncbi:MAG: zinc ABC transporter substrate-binding protein [Firmicutes bacterium]|nr:zinc ABC transporter substrate-binding protein [Bacillota bacterium]